MTSESPSPKPPRCNTRPKFVEDAEAIRDKEALAISYILPEAKNDPDLYQRVIDKLHGTGVGRCVTWSQYHCSHHFGSWAIVASDEERPSLEFFLTALAAHQALSRTSNDKFTNEVRRRGLILWARKKLQPKALAAVKNEKHHANRSPDESPTDGSSENGSDEAHPSIEQSKRQGKQGGKWPSKHSPTPPSLQGSPQPASPFPPAPSLKRKRTAYFEPHAGRTQKAVNSDHEPHRAPVPTSNAATQTDNIDEIANGRMEDIVNRAVEKVADAMKKSFGEALAQQTRTLTEFLPMAVRQAFRQDVADEVARHQPRAMRPAEPEMALARPAYSAYPPSRAQTQVYDMGEYQYEDVRTVGGRGRGLTTIAAADLDRLVGLEAYRVTRGPEQRRF
ncbi:hypothetical protein BKA56DRAFT_615879 [Ilyonectria sp. MPI-CAGE-AT-0026]|nr:hypothetical protein BKA56DRAFT_615879 [Ilyonectria sp. MPI-CAGE-AT-0026]